MSESRKLNSPWEIYQAQVQQGWMLPNFEQEQLVKILENTYQQLEHPRFSWWRRKTVRGVYIWGSVGVGKTHLMDLFYHAVNVPKKRLHFHAFMHWLHQKLKNWQGQQNPLDKIGREIAKENKLLCFDEFFVSNIGDAMILAQLLKALFKYGVCLVASSNTAPQELYKNGLQREQFLPAIALIESHMTTHHLKTLEDYRLRNVPQEGSYFTPLNAESDSKMEKSFLYYAHHQPINYLPIVLQARTVNIKKQAGGVVWFAFKDICGRPRSQTDYLEIAEKYQTVLISGLMQFQPYQHDLVVSFIHLIDILYDARIKTIISAAVPIEELYPEGKYQKTFQRTRSRLIEMQGSPSFLKNRQ